MRRYIFGGQLEDVQRGKGCRGAGAGPDSPGQRQSRRRRGGRPRFHVDSGRGRGRSRHEHQVSAQDCFWEDTGAFTGEIAVPMLKEGRLQVLHHRPLGTPPVLRRDRREDQQEGARPLQARPDAHHLLRRNARRARGRSHQRGRRDAVARLPPGAARRQGARVGHRLRARLGIGTARSPRPPRRRKSTR